MSGNKPTTEISHILNNPKFTSQEIAILIKALNNCDLNGKAHLIAIMNACKAFIQTRLTSYDNQQNFISSSGSSQPFHKLLISFSEFYNFKTSLKSNEKQSYDKFINYVRNAIKSSHNQFMLNFEKKFVDKEPRALDKPTEIKPTRKF